MAADAVEHPAEHIVLLNHVEVTGDRFQQVIKMGLLVMVHEDEDVEVFPCRIDGVELARRFLDMAGDPVEGGIVPTAADDLVRLRLRQLVVEPVVAG